MQPNNQPGESNSGVTPPLKSTNRVIQPLSSADDIRAELESPTQPADNTPEQPTEPAGAQGYRSTLVTEPLHSDKPQTNSLQPQRPVFAEPVKKAPRARRGVLLAVTLLIVGAGAAAAYLFFFDNKVSANDLVETTVEDTSYLYPKQWKEVNAGIRGYGDLRGESGKSTAVVTVNITPSAMGSVSTENVEPIRTQLLNTLSEKTVQPAFQSGGATCSSGISLNKEADDSRRSSTIGLYKLTATCQGQDKRYVLKMRGVVGYDGRMRTIALMATQSLWDKNGQTFDTIIDSVKQAD